MDDLELFKSLGISLALGLLIGLERGWHGRNLEEGHRAAGLRTFGLIGLFGGVTALLSQEIGPWVLGVGLGGIILLTTAAYYRHSGKSEGIGFTSEVAAVLTFCYGAAVLLGRPALASAAAVITALLLSLKPVLHGILQKLEQKELYATLKLLLISVVLLPILPDEGYGPWEILNPYQIWWMIVLIAGISFVGYFAMKIGGPRHGAVLTGLFGGLVSSTAVTLSLARFARTNAGIERSLASGIMAACATMFLRVLLVAIAVNPRLLSLLLLPLGVAALLAALTAFLLWRTSMRQTAEQETALENPFQLSTAIKFGALLALILVLSEAVRAWLGNPGLYILSAVSGITDVDAITLSVSRMSLRELPLQVALLSIFIAIAVNSLVKSIMSLTIGGKRLGIIVGSALGGILAVGFILLWLVL